VYERLRATESFRVSAQPIQGAAEGYWRITASLGELPAPRSVQDDGADLELASVFYPADLLTSTTPGEFRPVFSVFCNVKTLPGSSAIGDFMPIFFRLLHQYGGYLCRVGRIGAGRPGGTFLLFWGAATSRENDMDPALGFLLDLRAQCGVPLRAGVTYGVAYAGFVGASLREEYTCYGLSVNLAARQMAAAAWGDIWLDAETAWRAAARFEIALVGRREFKGV